MISKGLRSFLTTVIMGLSAYCGSLIYQGLHLWLAFISPKAFRWYIDVTMSLWTCSTISLIEWIIGVKCRLFGDKITSAGRAIFIMNHRTRLDWLYFYGILLRHGSSLMDEKIVLKNELKRIPGPGWAMQCGSYIFLERNLHKDKAHLSNMISYFSSVGHNTKVLIFPEGTDMSMYSRQRSDEFADKMGLQHYQNVLHPRTAGFVHIAREMHRHFPDFDTIYDITVGYPDKNFATNELQFAMGYASSEVHFYCRRYSLKTITGSTDSVLDYHDTLNNDKAEEEWSDRLRLFVNRVWDDKEKLLSDYYQLRDNNMPRFPGPEVVMPSVLGTQLTSVTVICGNVLACLWALLVVPGIFVPILVALNGLFAYIDLFQGGVDKLAIRLALRAQRAKTETITISSHLGGSGDKEGSGVNRTE